MYCKPGKRRRPLFSLRSGLYLALTATACRFISATAFNPTSVFEDVFARPHYQVYFGRDVVRPSDIVNNNDPSLVVMPAGGRSGQIYACRLPSIHPGDEAEAHKERDRALAAREATDSAMEVREALSAVLDMKKKCLQYGQGWFTYEYCHLSHVRQYHKPDLPSVDGAAEFYLGIDQASTVAEKLRRKKLLDGGRSLKKSELRSTAVAEVKVGGDGRKYLSIWYGDGTECDLTGKPRVVEVQFQCPARPHDPPDHITLIQEVSTCSYLLVIHTTRLCHLAPFNPVENSRVESISCAMVVSDGYYELVQAGGGWSDGKSASEIGEGDHAQTAEEGARQGRLTAAESSELFPHLFPTVNRIGSRHKSDWREAEEAKRHRESEPEADDEPAGDGSGLREVKIRGAEPGKRLTLEDVMKIVADQLGVHLGNDNEGDDDAEDSEDAKYVKVEDAEGRDILVRVFNGDGAGEHETMEEGRREKGKKGKKKGDS